MESDEGQIMTTSVTIKMSLEQAYTLEDALEFYSRMNMGQFETLEYMLRLDTFDQSLKRPKYDQELAVGYLRQARQTIFTDLSTSSYVGIMHTSERSKISWDIYQQLRHDISHFKFPNEPIETRGNAFQKPLITSEEPLPKITIEEE
jgi:hypothetical protein